PREHVPNDRATRRWWRWLLERSPEPERSLCTHQQGSPVPAREHFSATRLARVCACSGASSRLWVCSHDGRDTTQRAALSGWRADRQLSEQSTQRARVVPVESLPERDD